MNNRTLHHLIQIGVGVSEVSIDFPEELQNNPEFKPRGLALIGHPHPLMGGSMENKVAQTLAKTFNMLGYVAVRPNFRGVGQSQGSFDDGVGEIDDLEQILEWMQSPNSWKGLTSIPSYEWMNGVENLPFALAGFSFGSFVNSNLTQRLMNKGQGPERLVLIGSAAGKWDMPNIPKNTIVIHGEIDDTIPLQAVFDWLKEQEVIVHVIPGADHFFHRKLHLIRDTVIGLWHAK